MKSGVPQGSVIGPLLFSLFINDLDKKELNCQIKLFADDLKIYKVIRSPLNCKMLQCALNAISNWSDIWQLPIAVTKCACLVLNSVEKSAVQSEKGVSFRVIKNFHFEKNKKMYFGMFLKHYLRCIKLNHMKFFTFNKSFIIYLMT